MNLLEKYLSKPDNYQLVGAGGTGKTTSLQYMQQEMLKERTKLPGTEEVVIPIYIRMAIFNFREIKNEVLYEYIGSYFELENRRAKDLIENMFRENVGKYRFLLMLDGVNELIDKKGEDGENSIYTKFENDLESLLKHSNVNIICSTRNKKGIFNGNNIKKFNILNMQPLTQEQINTYIHVRSEYFNNGFFEEILKTPMLLKMFKVVYDYNSDIAKNLSNKYALIDNYMKAEISLREIGEYRDDNQEVRRYILNYVLPYIAYFVEKNMVKRQGFEGLFFEELLQEAYKNTQENNDGHTKKTVEIILKGMNLVTEELIFSHDLIREFFAFKYMKVLIEKHNNEEVASFLGSLIQDIKYAENNKISNQVQNFDFAELMMGYYGGKPLEKILQKAGIGEKESLILVQNLFQEIAGVYDDLGSAYFTEGAKYGWKSYTYLQLIKDSYNEFELASKINFISYCVVKKNSPKETWELLDRAEEYILLCEKKNDFELEKVHKLKAKIYSNKGAFYYNEELGNDYFKAIEYYEKSLAVREVIEDENGISICKKNIMQSYYHLENYEEAYKYYLVALDKKINNVFSVWYMQTYIHNPKENQDLELANLVERGIGTEMNLLSNNELSNTIQNELCYEIPYVFDYFSSDSRRNDRNSLISLRDKLKSLSEKDLAFKTKIVVKDYLKKCNEILGDV